ncbi:MAG: membrane protein [Elioraea sp.]|nr:MAG: membrane protein [Elioraea sp.]
MRQAMPRPSFAIHPAGAVALALALVAGGFAGAVDATQALAWTIGIGFGLTLYHASFGFAGAFRRLLAEGRGEGLRAQMLLLALLVALFFPALEAGSLFGAPVRGLVFPAGVATVVGAFLFGVGMQLGGGCASGTLYTAGGGDGRMVLTLVFFVLGATLAAWQGELWLDWPALPAVTVQELLGPWPALAGSLAVFALVFVVSAARERRITGTIAPLPVTGGRFWRGPWPLAWGAAGLALLSLATLWALGRPWVITAPFPLWGSAAVEALGWDEPAFWRYWEDPARIEALFRPILADRSTAMNLGLMAGALLAAVLAGAFAPSLRLSAGEAGGSVIGGVLLGIGAMLASGCNISAYVSGIASGSLHGWAWILPALAGNWVGLRLRPALGLAVPAEPDTRRKFYRRSGRE